MRATILTAVLAISITPVHGAPFLNILDTLQNNPIASFVNGFIPGQNKNNGATAAPTTAAATSAPATATQTGKNGQKGTAQNTFNPNAPLPPVPTAAAAFATGAPALTNKAQASSLVSACSAWVSDTGAVSNFQNIGAGLVLNAGQFKSQANIGLLAEKDELIHKGIIDSIIGLDPRISKANLTLTNGSFQSVIDGLQDMTTNGPAKVGDIAAINKVRCPQILPAIDTYCVVAASFAAQVGVTVATTAAIRPSACATGNQKQKRPFHG
jgi:hypothetical protein